MLTKKQQIKLILLTQDPEFGHMLVDVIETWKIASPIKGRMGVEGFIDGKKYTFCDNEQPECCLLGAAAVNRVKIQSEYRFITEDVAKYYKLSIKDCWNIVSGYDNHMFCDTDENSNAFKFGEKVRRILFK